MISFLSYVCKIWNEKLGAANSHFYFSLLYADETAIQKHTHKARGIEREEDGRQKNPERQIVFMHVVFIHQNSEKQQTS